MGNCQTTNVNVAALMIQHPNGRTQRLYWSLTAGEVMKLNPGHYVSLIIHLPIDSSANNDQSKVVSFTHGKLLRPHEPLLLGRSYRLVTTQEVLKVIRAKKYGKGKRNHNEWICRLQPEFHVTEQSEDFKDIQHEDQSQKQKSAKFAAARSKSWQPSLRSISEAEMCC